MRVLLVVDYAEPVAGAEISTLRLRDGLRARGHEVRVFASDALASEAESFADDRCRGTTGPLRGALQTCNPWAFVALRRTMRTFEPEVVVVGLFLTQLSPVILPLLRGVPSVHRAHWRRLICPLGTKRLPDGRPCGQPWGVACLREGCLPLHDWGPTMLQMELVRRWRSAFDVIVANSDMVRISLEAHGLSPVVVVHPGTEDRRAPTGPGETPLIAFAGRLIPKKGLDVLLSAFERVSREVPAARLLIAGDGPEMPAARSQIEAAGLASSVTFSGHVPQEELDAQLAGAWVQVVPSRYEEPFGLVAIEAMMRGTAVVASRVGGLAEIVVDHETGLLVPSEEPDALADALLTILADRDLATRMGEAGRTRAIERFSIDLYVDRFESILQKLVRSEAHAAS